jgi:hypothetical protein
MLPCSAPSPKKGGDVALLVVSAASADAVQAPTAIIVIPTAIALRISVPPVLAGIRAELI